MQTEVRVVAAAGRDGRTRLTRLEADGQLAVRATGTGPGGAARVHLVGAAAGPLAGDEVRVILEVGPGAALEVGSAGASIVLPGRSPGGRAEVRTEIRVAAGGRLDLACEPTVVSAGADLRTALTVDAAPEAVVTVRDVVVLGRHGEPPGRWTARVSAAVGGLPVLRSTQHGILASARGARAVAAVLALVSTGQDGGDPAVAARAVRSGDSWAVAAPLPAGGWSATAWGPDVIETYAALGRVVPGPRSRPRGAAGSTSPVQAEWEPA
ncbi:MAG: urease accessory protein UreD [Kineosporiaceae bacterium]